MTKSTNEGTGNKAPALFFYPDGVELPDYIYICVTFVMFLQKNNGYEKNNFSDSTALLVGM